MKNKVVVKTQVDFQKAWQNLEDLILAGKTGSIYIQKGKKELTVNPKDVCSFEFEASQKKTRGKISIVLKWDSLKIKEEKPVDFKITQNNSEKNFPEKKSKNIAQTKSVKKVSPKKELPRKAKK